MQNLPAHIGARGWPWHIERIEASSRPSRTALLHLVRPHAARVQTLVAVRPFEPVAALPPCAGLLAMPAVEAAAIAAEAKRRERAAFAAHAADRLRGDVHAWQLAAALAFERGHSRVLLADDAGMGKTVSAAIAIAQCLDGSSDGRCLVLAPGHLLRQWHEELRARLGIDASIVDAAALRRLQREVPAGISVWSLPGCLVASIDFLKQPHILASLASAIWDVLVIDEAHLACGMSERRDAAHLIARRARRVLLLTATPSDGGSERLAALLALGAAGKGDEPPVRLRHSAPVSRSRVERTLWVAPGAATRALHDTLAAYTRWIASGPRAESSAVPLLCSLLTKRALSSAHALHISLERRLALIGRDPQPVQASLFEPDEDPGVLGAGTGLPVESERRRLASLAGMAARAAREDRRLRALVRLVTRAREPVVVFTCFRDTALLLAARLSSHAATRLVHGHLPQAAIEAALDAFIEGPAQVLVATDVAAQGLNLHQRCRWVVHYDLPWRPPAIRQRLGRVDRLGQARVAHATFLLDRTPLAAGMLARMTSLTSRMHEDARGSGRRWDVMAAADARRVRAVRGPAAEGAPAKLPRGPVTVVEIVCAGASGMTVERTVAAIATAGPTALEWAARQGERRRTALRRALSARASRRIAREHAVCAAALEKITPALRQEGLFERRADRGRLEDAAVRARVLRLTRDAIERHALEGILPPARVRIVATFLIEAP